MSTVPARSQRRPADRRPSERHTADARPSRTVGSTLTGPAPVLSGILAAAAALAGGLTFFAPDVLRGPDAMNGSARGTALVVLVLAVPTLLAAQVLTRRGSARALLVWVAATAYLLYNAVLFVFATPLNSYLLLYLLMLSSAIWSLLALLVGLDARRLAARVSPSTPVRAIAGYAWVVVALNAFAWLSPALRALVAGEPARVLDGMGLTTNPVWVQDLTFWLPSLAYGGFLLWRRRPWGYVVAGGGLTMLVIESVGIAVDQWFGSQADPTSPVVSAALVPVFAALAVVGYVPVHLLMRNIDRRNQDQRQVPRAR